MSRVVGIQSNYTTGEVDPLLHSRIDIEQYYNSLAQARNVLIQPQGGVTRRPGLQYVGEIPSAATPQNGCRLVPFEYSTTQSYMLLFTNNRMFIYKDKVLQTNINSSGNDYLISHARDWNSNYELDLIGREYCRDRQIPVSKEEFNSFMIWQQAKGQLIMAHYKWIKTILNQMKEIKLGLKGYKYLDEAIELCTELGLSVNDAEIIRTNSTGLVIYNPKNLADRIKGMKNKNITREQKIALRKAYNQQQSTQ